MKAQDIDMGKTNFYNTIIGAYSFYGDTTTTDFFSNIKNYDLAPFWAGDRLDVVPFSVGDSMYVDQVRVEFIGYIDTNYQRFQIHFTSASKKKTNLYEYEIKGKTMVKKYICDFQGTMKIKEARLFNDTIHDFYNPSNKEGYVICEVLFYEDKKQTGSGYIKGKATTLFVIDYKGKLKYGGPILNGDRGCNNQFECIWTSYKTKKSKKCNWGNERIPDSQYPYSDLDLGVGDFYVNDKYLKNGWENYMKSYYGDSLAKQIEKEWWK